MGQLGALGSAGQLRLGGAAMRSHSCALGAGAAAKDTAERRQQPWTGQSVMCTVRAAALCCLPHGRHGAGRVASGGGGYFLGRGQFLQRSGLQTPCPVAVNCRRTRRDSCQPRPSAARLMLSAPHLPRPGAVNTRPW